jgi:hypothetical protein
MSMLGLFKQDLGYTKLGLEERRQWGSAPFVLKMDCNFDYQWTHSNFLCRPYPNVGSWHRIIGLESPALQRIQPSKFLILYFVFWIHSSWFPDFPKSVWMIAEYA